MFKRELAALTIYINYTVRGDIIKYKLDSRKEIT